MPHLPTAILLPLDARPVCLALVQDAATMAGIELICPPADILGHLKQPADRSQLLGWLSEALSQHPKAPLIASIDLVLYGGLIPSRSHTYTQEELEARLNAFLEHPELGERTIYAFSSIMRIPNYNNAEEEPDYWEDWGESLYKASVQAHQLSVQNASSPPGRLTDGDIEVAFKTLPTNVWQDFWQRRKINHALNQVLLNTVADKRIHALYFAQDDTGAFGLNVFEARELEYWAHRRLLPVTVQTGADEIALVLLARLAREAYGQPLHIATSYSPADAEKCIAKFDGVPVGVVAHNKITGCGALPSPNTKEADLTLFINGPRGGYMGDHCELAETGPVVTEAQHDFILALHNSIEQHRAILADVAYANGSDPALINALIESSCPLAALRGYAGWNTPGNSIGTAVALGVLHWVAQHNNCLNSAAHQQLLLTRFLDDYGYQAVVRKQMRDDQTDPHAPDSVEQLNTAMNAIAKQFVAVFPESHARAIRYTWPCQRTFEVAIQLSTLATVPIHHEESI